MRWSVAAGLTAVALAAGAAASIGIRRASVQAIPGDIAGAALGADYVVTPMTAIELGHRRALEYLRGDESRTQLIDAANRASRSVVRVITRRVSGATTTTSSGSGVVVGERRVLTARHLVHADTEGLEILVRLADGTEIAARVVERGDEGSGPFEHDGDWLLLEVTSGMPRLPPPLGMAAAPAGALVVAIGFGGNAGLGSDGRATENADGPSGFPTWSVGKVADAKSTSLEPLAGSLPISGASGGPVVDSTGAVVGVVSGLKWTTSTSGGAPPIRVYSVNVAPVGGAESVLTAIGRRSR